MRRRAPLALLLPVAAHSAPTPPFDEEFDGTTLNPSVWYPCYPWADAAVGCTTVSPIDLEWYLPHRSNPACPAARSRPPRVGRG